MSTDDSTRDTPSLAPIHVPDSEGRITIPRTGRAIKLLLQRRDGGEEA